MLSITHLLKLAHWNPILLVTNDWRHFVATARYDDDVIAWAEEQAKLLRSKQFDALDIENIAEEIEDVGKSEQRELESRMAVLLAHLLKWQLQPKRRGASWLRTINIQRTSIERRLRKTPSLKRCIYDVEWWEDAWGDARVLLEKETGIVEVPRECPWTIDQVLDLEFVP